MVHTEFAKRILMRIGEWNSLTPEERHRRRAHACAAAAAEFSELAETRITAAQIQFLEPRGGPLNDAIAFTRCIVERREPTRCTSCDASHVDQRCSRGGHVFWANGRWPGGNRPWVIRVDDDDHSKETA